MPIFLTITNFRIADVVYGFPVMNNDELVSNFSIQQELVRSEFFASLDVLALKQDRVFTPILARKFQSFEIESSAHYP